VLDVKLPFDEAQLLADNTPYLLRALNLQGITISSAAAPGAAEAAKAVGADISGAAPGQPTIHFSSSGAAAAAGAVASS
jgi:hypothetical protein